MQNILDANPNGAHLFYPDTVTIVSIDTDGPTHSVISDISYSIFGYPSQEFYGDIEQNTKRLNGLKKRGFSLDTFSKNSTVCFDREGRDIMASRMITPNTQGDVNTIGLFFTSRRPQDEIDLIHSIAKDVLKKHNMTIIKIEQTTLKTKTHITAS